MPTPTKEGERDIYGQERCKESCGRVWNMMRERPWITGDIVETIKNGVDDENGIDMFAHFDQRLVEMMCLEQDERGMKIQIKSDNKKEEKFVRRHKERVFNLGSGDSYFLINGQERVTLMLASLVGQMVVMAGLSGYVSEEVMLDFIANDLHDEEAVLQYIKHRNHLIDRKWFKSWLNGSKIDEWKKFKQELQTTGNALLAQSKYLEEVV